PKMKALSLGLLNLRLPGPGTETVFAPSVTVSDLGPVPVMTATGADRLESKPWPLATGPQRVEKVDLWRSLLDAVSWFDNAQLYIMSGDHPKGDSLRYEAKAGFEALARMKSGEWRSLHGTVKLTWQRAQAGASAPASDWQIAE